MVRKNINNYIFVPSLVLSLFLQFTFLPQLPLGDFFPDLSFFILIVGSFLYKNDSIFFLAFFVGLLFDVFSGQYFGTTIISILLAVLISSYFSHYFLKEIFSLETFLISSLAVISYNASFFILMNLFNSYKYLGETGRFFNATVFDVLYLAILVYPLISLFSFNRNEK